MGLHRKMVKWEIENVLLTATRHIKVPNILLISKRTEYPIYALDTSGNYEFTKVLHWVLRDGKFRWMWRGRCPYGQVIKGQDTESQCQLSWVTSISLEFIRAEKKDKLEGRA